MSKFFYYANPYCEERFNFFRPRYLGLKDFLKDYKPINCSKADILVFDTETTGFSPANDDILQLSIIDGNGIQIFNEYFKPTLKPYWGDDSLMNESELKAMSINNIGSKELKNTKPFSYYKDCLNEIFDNASLIVGYNKAFDLNFLQSNGIYTCAEKKGFDPLCAYPFLFPQQTCLSAKGRYSYSLSNVCKFNNYIWEEDAHNSLGDVKATLFVFEMCQSKLENLEKSLNFCFDCRK